MVHQKLMQARIKLQGMDLKKTGENKFAGYKYFELGDFLPQTMQIFHDLKLASTVSFTSYLATLSILDYEDGTTLTITSPMAEANLKGAHPIQNLGAVESYQRRYLWLAAMEIVEHDIIDASEPSKPKEAPKVESKRPPATVKGKDGEWQLKVSLKPEGDPAEWLSLIDGACQTMLALAENEDDVMQIFRKNKQLFDAVKAHDAEFFKFLMTSFTKTKAQFTKETK